MENQLSCFLAQYNQTQRIALCFLNKKFGNSSLTSGDFEDAISTAFEKLLLDAAKPQPTLTPSNSTICRLAFFALCDTYRKRKREVLTDDFSKIGPLSISASEDYFLDTKQRIEAAIDKVQTLPKRQRALIEAKYDARQFSTSATLEEMAAFKNRPPVNLTIHLGFSTPVAMRQDLFRGIRTLRLVCRA